MPAYAVTHRQRDGMWTIRSGGRTGTVIEKYDTRQRAAERAREIAKPDDTLKVYNMDGSVSRSYENPRL